MESPMVVLSRFQMDVFIRVVSGWYDWRQASEKQESCFWRPTMVGLLCWREEYETEAVHPCLRVSATRRVVAANPRGLRGRAGRGAGGSRRATHCVGDGAGQCVP